MIDRQTIDACIALLKREVVPATGCTEPVAVALATARAAAEMRHLGHHVQCAQISLSANMLKNAMGVGIPGTGMIGLPIAVALGIEIAAPEKELSVLEGFSPEILAAAKERVAAKQIEISLAKGDVDKLYISATLRGDGHSVTARIEQDHRRFTWVDYDGTPVFQLTDKHEAGQSDVDEEDLTLTFDTVYRFATETPLEDIEFVLDSALLNQAASEMSLQGNYGHAVGRMIQGQLGQCYLGSNALTEMLTYTSAACDARMDGAPVSVMSNSGSGNQGITATLPVYTLARREGKSHEETIRALALSNLMVIYIKQHLGRLSALCGCVVAATGSSCGIAYLLGGTREQIGFAIKNMVGNLTGMLCDGAKPSCSMKVSSGVSTAMFSALLALENKGVTESEGIVDKSVDRTIENLTSIGRDGMNKTDQLVLNIMTSKE